MYSAMLVLLFVGEQAGSGVQGPPRLVERVTGAAAVPVGVLLDSAPAPVERVAGQADHMEGVHDRDRVGELFGGGGLEPGEPIHRDDLHTVAPGLRPLGEPGLEHLLGTALDHVQQACWPSAVADRGQIDDDGDVLVPTTGVTPHVLIDPEGSVALTDRALVVRVAR